ncbi:MAG: EAL domain-containing protein [Hungatella sp.]
MEAIHDEQWIKEKYEEICRQNPADYVLISLKIKRFRIFNRLFGREAGDRLLERVYEAIQDWIGEEEYAAHLYLDYYNMLVKVPHDYSTIVQYVTDFSHMIRDMKDDEGFGQVFIGLGIYPLEDDSTDFYTAQYNADVCRAECPERTYRNSHFEIYSMTYHDLNLHYFDLEQEIKPALEHGDFKLYLQPKVDLKTGKVTKAEALVRWIDPVKGMIPVSEFLPALVENGLIENVDLHLFGIVCSTVERWRQQYGKEISIRVNLNECAFNYEFFFNDYKEVYERNPCRKDCIEFELLESIILNQVDQVNRVVNDITQFGFTCSVDDFGSGYSSYSVLTNPRITTLKIDRSLFRNDNDPREKTLIRSIIQTAKELNMTTVAEGVETKEYVDFLKELGCDYVQGFYYYKPMSVEDFEELFVKNPIPSA